MLRSVPEVASQTDGKSIEISKEQNISLEKRQRIIGKLRLTLELWFETSIEPQFFESMATLHQLNCLNIQLIM